MGLKLEKGLEWFFQKNGSKLIQSSYVFYVSSPPVCTTNDTKIAQFG